MRFTRLVRVALAGVVALTALMLGQPALADGGCWECYGPGLPDPCRNSLYSVAIVEGSGGADAWAVGDKGAILRWNGSAWSKMASASADSLRAVAAPRSNLALAVGLSGKGQRWNGSAWSTLSTTTTNWLRTVGMVPGSNGANGWAAADYAGVGLFLHWNGSAWESRYGNKTHFFGGTIYGLEMLSANEGYAVGAAFRSDIGNYGGQAYHWDGSTWTHFDAPEPDLFAVDMLSSTNGWAVGEDGAIVHWDGASWSLWPSSPTTDDLRAVAMLSSTDGWAVGENGTILRWNGSAWTTFTSPVTQELRGLAGVSASHGWAVGLGGVILRWNGSAWNVITAPAAARLEDFSMAPVGLREAWAVGSGRAMLRWTGSGWQSIQGPATSYYAVDMVSATDGWATAPGNRFYRWNGSSWNEAGRPASAQAIDMLSATDGWAVGWGKIMRWDGSAWSLVTSPSTRTYYGVDAVSASNVWAVGDNGTIVHYDGSAWASVASPVTDWLVDVSMASASNGWAVGWLGLFLRWNGTAWTKYGNSATQETFRSVSVVMKGANAVGWAVGEGGDAYWLNNNTWTAGCCPTGNDLFDVEMISPYEAWAVGDHGVILHWVDPARPASTKRAYAPMTVR